MASHGCIAAATAKILGQVAKMWWLELSLALDLHTPAYSDHERVGSETLVGAVRW